MVPEGRDVVDWLREVYCTHIIESESQLRYIERMTGATTTAEARDFMGGFGGSGAGTHGGWTSTSAGKSSWVEGYNGTSKASEGKGWVSVAKEKFIQKTVATLFADYKCEADIVLDTTLSATRRKKLLKLWKRRHHK
jgi:hypothetical protein